jgi:3-hydroxyisobutyrate dehydrogenase-like beta-hydroxyacid dehydrogenase
VNEVAAVSEITLTSLPNPTVVTAVAEEWARSAAPGSILLELSTTLPESNRAIAAKLAASGQHLVEAPLTGGAIGAQNRGLVFMVGGDDEPVGRCLPLLDQLGRATFHVGPVGAGTTMKLANSLLAMACTWASFESLSLAAKAGIDLRTAVEVIRTAGVTNFYIDRGVEGINVRGKPAEFTLELAAKDAGLINEIAAATGVPAEIAQAARSLLDDAVARGLGDHDWTDLVLAAEARAGVDLHLPAKKEG